MLCSLCINTVYGYFWLREQSWELQQWLTCILSDQALLYLVPNSFWKLPGRWAYFLRDQGYTYTVSTESQTTSPTRASSSQGSRSAVHVLRAILTAVHMRQTSQRQPRAGALCQPPRVSESLTFVLDTKCMQRPCCSCFLCCARMGGAGVLPGRL